MIAVRSAHPADLPAAADVWHAANAARGLPPTPQRLARVREKLAAPDAQVLIATLPTPPSTAPASGPAGSVAGSAGLVAVPAPSESGPSLAGPASSPTERSGSADALAGAGSAPAGSTAGQDGSATAPALDAAAASGTGAMPAEAGTVVGMALVEPGRADDGEGALIPGYGHVSMVFVHPSHWSNGYGQHLLRAVHALGYTRTTLWTRRSNERAQRLYAAAGYVPNGRTTHLFDGDEIIQLERRAGPV